MRQLNQSGAVLPSVLGVLVLILIISTQLTETVLSNHKINNAYQSQLKAESLAEFALNATEEELALLDIKPTTTQTISAIPGNTTQINQGIVWQRDILDYDLEGDRNTLTGQDLDWTQQPQSWWEIYANTYTLNLSATHAENAYSIIEEYGEDFSGSDLGQARDYYSGPSNMLYQITSRAGGGAFGTSRLQSIARKIYR